MPDAPRPDPRSRFQQSTEPNACLIDGLPWAEWLKQHQQARAATKPADGPPPPPDHPATAMADEIEAVQDDRVVRFDFSFE